MRVSAVIPTRGNVDMQPVLDSLPADWEIIVWVNGECVTTYPAGVARTPIPHPPAPPGHWPDLAVYARYAAIEHASNELIYTQDDDVIVSDPQAIVDKALVWDGTAWVMRLPRADEGGPKLVANMPQEFRHDGYTDSCLVGFGACFHRDAPARAFERFMAWDGWSVIRGMDINDVVYQIKGDVSSDFERTCDVVFTTLTPRVLVDVPKTDREFASDPDRMWKQPSHYGERTRMLELARKVRDAN